MLKIREGNKFTWTWAITRGTGPEDLSQATQIKFSYQFRDKAGRVNITEFTKAGNIISTAFLFAGVQGIVNLRLTYELPVIGPCAVDVDAFEIVASSEEASEGGEFSMTSDMAIALQGKNAYEVWLETHEGTLEDYEAFIKGDPFLYSDFTPEQVEALKVKGDKGDSFEYEDFTPEQITALKQPATDAAASVQEVEEAVEQAEGLRATAESGRVTAEGLRVTAESNRSGAELLRSGAESDRSGAELLRAGAEDIRIGNEEDREQAEALRVQAEIDRQTNTGTAIQNAETATGQAKDAAILANTKAGLADTAATNANTKAGLADTAATNANTKAGLAETAATNADNARLAIQADLASKENTANKQNSLATDGTGVKFPTVDAVKSRADEIESLIIRKLVEPLGATYNTTTKLFSLNGLTDITEAQMINIYNYTAVMIKASLWSEAFNNVSFRTNIQGASKGNISVQANYSFQNNPALEVFKMSNGVFLTLSNNMFYGCGALREVDYLFMLMTTAGNVLDMFRNCGALVTCYLRIVKVNLSFAWSPLLSLASLQYLIQYRANGTTPITITVHPTVFAKLTDNTNYPTWYAVNQDALTKYITFASA